MRTVGLSVPRRNARSLAGVMFRKMSRRLPAMVTSLTGFRQLRRGGS